MDIQSTAKEYKKIVFWGFLWVVQMAVDMDMVHTLLSSSVYVCEPVCEYSR